AAERACFFPRSFGLVMGAGIISNALLLNGYASVSNALFGISLLAYPWLLLLTLVRLTRFRRAIWADLTNPRLVFSFFTFVAATDVLGVGVHLRGFSGAAALMWCTALAIWFVLIYFSFAVLTFLNTARDANVVHGGWLIAIVGTESLVILGSIVGPQAGGLAPAVFVLIHMLWGIGIAL